MSEELQPDPNEGLTVVSDESDNKLLSDDYEKSVDAVESLYIPKNMSGRIQFMKKYPLLAERIMGEELMNLDKEGTADRKARMILEKEAAIRHDEFLGVVKNLEQNCIKENELQREYVDGLIKDWGREISLMFFGNKFVNQIFPPPPEEEKPEPEAQEAPPEDASEVEAPEAEPTSPDTPVDEPAEENVEANEALETPEEETVEEIVEEVKEEAAVEEEAAQPEPEPEAPAEEPPAEEAAPEPKPEAEPEPEEQGIPKTFAPVMDDDEDEEEDSGPAPTPGIEISSPVIGGKPQVGGDSDEDENKD